MSTDIHDVVRDLTKLVGPTSVKILADVTDYGPDLAGWLGRTKQPTPDQEKRLRTALELIEMFDDLKQARVWFRSENTFLRKKGWTTSPCVAIQRGYYTDARRSAKQTVAELK